ncbi:MAG: hypothetical protein WCW53_00310 [Syntrophales bacterium]
MKRNGREKSREAEHKRRSAQRQVRRRLTIIWMLIITFFCILVMAVVHFSPIIIQKFTIVDEYLPRDLDRHYMEMQDIKKKLQDIKK